MIKYPRKVNTLGTERNPCALLIQSKLNTCGVLVLGRRGGNSPNAPSSSPPHELFIYLDGTTSLTPRMGGVTEATTAPATGVALTGAAIPQGAPFNPERMRGITIMGSNRQSSSVKICGAPLVTNDQNLPALGLMYSSASNVRYIYLTDTGRFLCYGDENAWIAGDPTNKVVITAAPAGSGSLGNRRDGRTVFGNDDDNEGLVVASGGKSAALILASGDHATAIALYIDATGTPKFDTAANWWTYVTT